jgi:endonuclease/exonuclease/phosphatase family metal-dependent hydrolase
MRKSFFCFICFFVPLVSAFAEAPNAENDLPKTSEEIQNYLREIQDRTTERIQQIIETAKEEDISGKMLRPWNRLSNEITSAFRVLFYISDNNPDCQEEAVKGMEKFKRFLHASVIKNKELYDSLMTYVQKSFQENELLSPYEREGVYSLLHSFNAVGFQEKIISLKSFFSTKERHAFIRLESPTVINEVQKPEELSVLTLNACFMPDAFPYLYGGATLPWQERVKSLSEEVINTNADVVCLQEVFSEDAFYALYDELKNDYKYFYGLIGPRFLGLSFQSVGMPSGLFVASKYPIQNPQFNVFKDRGFPMNQGFFDFIVNKSREISSHIYVTHMQSLNDKKFIKVRALQSKQIIEKIQKDAAKSKDLIPYVLCGDLNVPFGSKEASEELIRSNFYDDYNKGQGEVNESNSTCTSYFSNYLFSRDKDPKSVEPDFQILDYTLLWKNSRESFLLSTVRVEMNDLKKPNAALSDHHGLLSKIQKKPSTQLLDIAKNL